MFSRHDRAPPASTYSNDHQQLHPSHRLDETNGYNRDQQQHFQEPHADLASPGAGAAESLSWDQQQPSEEPHADPAAAEEAAGAGAALADVHMVTTRQEAARVAQLIASQYQSRWFAVDTEVRLEQACRGASHA